MALVTASHVGILPSLLAFIRCWRRCWLRNLEVEKIETQSGAQAVVGQGSARQSVAAPS